MRVAAEWRFREVARYSGLGMPKRRGNTLDLEAA
jgi:hypothetical protein